MAEATEQAMSAPQGKNDARLMTDSSIFLAALLLATLFPLLFVPLALPMRSSIETVDQVFRILLLMSTMHVGLTAYFYFDGNYRKHAVKHYQFYFV